MFYGISVSPPRALPLKKHVIPRKGSLQTKMAGDGDKTPPSSPKKPSDGKGGGEKGDCSSSHAVMVERITVFTGEVSKLSKVNYHE
jgi:hypothetical protein